MHEVVVVSIGERIKAAREQKYKQDEFAEIVGVHKNTVSRWENNTRTPSSDVIPSIAKALDVSTSYLLGETDNPHTYKHSTVLDLQQEYVKRAIAEGKVVPANVVSDLPENLSSSRVAVIKRLSDSFKVCCGNGNEWFDPACVQQVVYEYESEFWDRSPLVSVPVYGDSMAPYINEGSRVLISETPGDVEYISNGKTVVARYEQKLLVRGLFRETTEDGHPRVILRAWNKAYRDIVINEWDDFHICGTVLRVDDSNPPQDMI